jgi:PAS domain S-box-containing protein
LVRFSARASFVIVDVVKDYAIFVVDDAGAVRTWNDGARIITGYDAGDIVGQSFARLFTPEDVASRKPERLLAAAAADGRVEDEGWRMRRGGERFWADVVLTPLESDGYVVVARDLTERHRAEQETARRQAAIAELGTHALRSTSPAELVAHALAVVRATLGTDVVDLFVTSEDGTLDRCGSVGWNGPSPSAARLGIDVRIERRFAPRGMESAASAPLDAKPNGLLVTYARTAHLFDDEDLDFLSAVAAVISSAFARDALEDRNSRAQAAVRERDEFISIAAHELRTPLTALQLKLDSARLGLMAEVPDVRRVGARLDGALRQADRLAVLVDRLLDVSRIVSGRFELHREPSNLVALVMRVVEDLREEAQRVGSEIITSGEGSLEVMCDPRRMEQVVSNILSNAIKYGAGKPIRIVVKSSGDDAVISVADKGIGIAPEDLARIFGRFQRASTQSYGGFGLGLYVARRILEAHGGEICAETTPGRGSTFFAAIPR